MIRYILVFLILGGTSAMAAPTDYTYDPTKMRVTPEGQARSPSEGLSKAEMFLMMWRQQAGNKPIPEDLRQKYGLPPDPQPSQPGQ